MAEKGPNILVACGKTGGHLFPGIACAQALRRMDKSVRILFVGTGSNFETATTEKFGFDHVRISSRPVKGKNLISVAIALMKIPAGIFKSLAIIRDFKPDAVLGTGAYTAFPVVTAAWLMGIKTCIHEQNSIPGLTNRVLSKLVDTIFISFEETKGFSNRKNALLTGNPVRREPAKETQENHIPAKDTFTIMVYGGSQGARSINNAVISALQLMETLDQYTIIHQTGEMDQERMQKAYEALGLKRAIVRGFFHDPGHFQSMADLIISRAGAGTISEITCRGLPSILIPYPYAADDHQTQNAKALEKMGGAIVIPDRDVNGSVLKKHVIFFKNNPERLAAMGKAAKKIAMPDADETIAGEILRMTSKGM